MKSFLFLTFLVSSLGQVFDQAAEQKFTRLVEKMEADAIELAQKVEEIYADRCDVSLLSECTNGNYDHCLSVFPDQSCPGGDDLNVAECGDGITCSGLYSYSVSNVRLPFALADGPDSNPTDPQAIETVCFTNRLDEYFATKRANDASFWDEFGYQPSGMYFGSHNGVFRIYPARRSEVCGVYDPRVRPWYVAASSGPKNIIMIVDTSGSMNDFNRIDLLKDAAKRIIGTATVGDRIAIIPFSDEASSITDNGLLYTASMENKKILLDEIDKLSAVGGTNFLAAFEKAFDVLDASVEAEFAVSCNTAILFLTDGEMTLPVGIPEQDVIDLVDSRLAQTSQRLTAPIYLFTYSISGGNADVDVFPSQLACSMENGVWSKIETEEEIVDSLSSFYRLFALGLGSGANEDFVAWVEPYEFESVGGILGTTVSVPVYDRTKQPNLFLGVVGIDFVVDALNAALGVTDSTSDEAFNRVVKFSTARCPAVVLDQCELESYRRSSSAGDEALCTNNCTASDFVQIEEEKCPTISDYPRDLWKNLDNRGVDYLESVCCAVGGTEVDDTCVDNAEPDSGPSTGAIAGIAIVSAAGLLAVAIGIFCYMKKDDEPDIIPVPVPPPATAPHASYDAPAAETAKY